MDFNLEVNSLRFNEFFISSFIELNILGLELTVLFTSIFGVGDTVIARSDDLPKEFCSGDYPRC